MIDNDYYHSQEWHYLCNQECMKYLLWKRKQESPTKQTKDEKDTSEND
jgi:hypothetical protein